MSYHDRVLKLREEKHRTAFEFHFEDLFTEEEWLNMSIKNVKKKKKLLDMKLKNGRREITICE